MSANEKSVLKNTGTLVPPKEALPVGEANGYLTKFKRSLSRRWSLTRMGVLYEISDLAVFLWALERDTEALAVAVSVAAGIPSPPRLSGGRFNYNIWCPATLLHALVVRLSSDASRSDISLAALLNDFGISRNNPEYIAEAVETASRLAGTIIGNDTIKWECQRLARTLGSMVLYSELAKAGDSVFKNHGPNCDSAIPELRSKLGIRLEGGWR
jgi:hypothetical protein